MSGVRGRWPNKPPQGVKCHAVCELPATETVKWVDPEHGVMLDSHTWLCEKHARYWAEIGAVARNPKRVKR